MKQGGARFLTTVGGDVSSGAGYRTAAVVPPRRGRAGLSGTNRVAIASRIPATPTTTKKAVALLSSVNPKRNGEAMRMAASA